MSVRPCRGAYSKGAVLVVRNGLSKNRDLVSSWFRELIGVSLFFKVDRVVGRADAALYLGDLLRLDLRAERLALPVAGEQELLEVFVALLQRGLLWAASLWLVAVFG